MGIKFAGVLVVAALSAGLAGCSGTAGPAAAPAATGVGTAPVGSSPAVPTTPVPATPAPSEAVPSRPATPKPARPAGDTASALPGGGTLVTIGVAGGGPRLVQGSGSALAVSKRGTALTFHVVGFDDVKNLQFSLSGDGKRCIEQTLTPRAGLKLATCDLDKRSQRFALNPAGQGAWYVHGTGRTADSFLYLGDGGVASFDVTADFEATKWVFEEQGFEPVD